MKKIMCFLLALALLFSLCGCSGGNTVNSENDLYGKRIGVIKNSVAAGSQKLKDYEGNLFYYDDKEAVLEALENTSIDCAVLEYEYADALNKKSPKVTVLETPFINEPYSFIAAKENIALTEDINSALFALSENGTLSKIIESYTKGGDYSYSPQYTEDMPTITLLVYEDNSPYTVKTESGYHGMNIDIASAVCDHLGIGLSVRTVNDGEDPVELIRSGEAQIAMGIVYSDDAAREVDFTESYFTSTQMILVRK